MTAPVRTTAFPPDHVPQVRLPPMDIDTTIPRHWMGGNAVASHLGNGLNMLFPMGERFFVRSVKYYADRIQNPRLRERVRGFFGQEGRHSKEHDRAINMIREQGYDVEPFLRFYDALAYRLIEKASPPELRLASTAACEHFTAIMAEQALRMGMLDKAHPVMRALLLWHAAEEIEHRSVAYDVLQEVNPSYALRVAGLAMAALTLSGFWIIGATSLMRQDEELTWSRFREEWKAVGAGRIEQEVFARGIRGYLRRDFHPSQQDVDELAANYLTQAGLA